MASQSSAETPSGRSESSAVSVVSAEVVSSVSASVSVGVVVLAPVEVCSPPQAAIDSIIADASRTQISFLKFFIGSFTPFV